jgi:NADPH:quinone reductase-like Zn-dependent oxidoreductase
MKAVICTKYGPPEVLQLREVLKPVPKHNEVLVKVYATTAFAGDCELRGLRFPFWFCLLIRLAFGIRGPRKKILGQELAGEIEAIGKDVRRYKIGDQVFGTSGFAIGGYAEYLCQREDGVLSVKPASMTYEEAAASVIGGLEALYYLGKGHIRSGQQVLINGAGGSIGTMAVQLAKNFGAEVTAVDSKEKLNMLSSIGADRVIDYIKEDFTKNGESYDVIFDVIGKKSFSRSEQSLNQEGIYLSANPGLLQMLRGPRAVKKGSRTAFFGGASHKAEDLAFLRVLIEAGKIKPVIDRGYPLEQIIEAHRYVDAGHKKGSVAIEVVHNRSRKNAD